MKLVPSHCNSPESHVSEKVLRAFVRFVSFCDCSGCGSAARCSLGPAHPFYVRKNRQGPMPFRVGTALVVTLFALAARAFAAEPTTAPRSDQAGGQACETRFLSGWTLHVSRDLLRTNATATARALQLLAAQLEYIARVVPKAAAAELQKVPLWISPAYPGTPPRAEYHPDAGWLREHGRDPAMAKAVEFTNVRIFEPETRRMPVFVLHELAHAYHDRVLGFDEPRIQAAYRKAKAGGQYDRVQRRDAQGRVSTGRAYALTDPKEYFAESTEAFFGTNDFFPFTRPELAEHDPAICRLLEELWGAGKPNQGPSPASPPAAAAK